MKTKVFFTVMVLLNIILASCSQSDELVYSCDSKIDAWVKDNLQLATTMDRSEWLKLDAAKATAIYRAFTPEQKIKFWRDKISEVKTLDWSEESIRHIEKLEYFIDVNPGLFEDHKLSDSENDLIDTFFYKWKKYGTTHLGWNERVAFAIAASGYRLVNTEGLIASPPAPDQREPNVDCNCSRQYDFCNYFIYSCEKADCSVVNDNCGFLWSKPCDGRCGGV